MVDYLKSLNQFLRTIIQRTSGKIVHSKAIQTVYNRGNASKDLKGY